MQCFSRYQSIGQSVRLTSCCESQASDHENSSDDNSHNDYRKSCGVLEQLNSNISLSGPEVVITKCNKDGQSEPSTTSHTVKLRNYEKKQACFYCKKIFYKIVRHYSQCHPKENAVSKFLEHPQNSKLRQEPLDQLRLRGNYKHNTKVLRNREGIFIVVRRMQSSSDANEFLPCINCLGFYLRSELYRHVTCCKYNKGFNHSQALNDGILLVLPFLVESKNEDFLQCLSSMKPKEAELVKNDDLLSTYCAVMLELHGKNCHIKVTRKMNYILKMLEAAKVDDEYPKLIDLLKADNLDFLYEKSRCFPAEDDGPDLEKISLRIGLSLKDCAFIAKSQSIENNDECRENALDEFLKMFKVQWLDRITSPVVKNLSNMKINKEIELPLTRDLKQLCKYICDQLTQITSNLSSSNLISSSTLWQEISSLVLCKLLLLNKKKGAEVSRMRLEDYADQSNWVTKDDVHNFDALSFLERKLAERLSILKVPSKANTYVAILIPGETKKVMDILLSSRDKANINKENKYFFADQGDQYIKWLDCLKKICETAKIENFVAINNTNMRKYVSTVCQVLTMAPNEVTWLDEHFRNELYINLKFYQLHQSFIELNEVSKLLIEIDAGKASQYSMKEKIGESDIVAEGPESKRKIHWKSEEKSIALDYFKDYIKSKKIPGKYACLEFLAMKRMSREWTDVKYLIKNEFSPATKDHDGCPKGRSNGVHRRGKGGRKQWRTDNEDSSDEEYKPSKKKGGKRRTFWSTEEKDQAMKYFQKFIEKKVSPGKEECETFLLYFKINRDWKNVKYLIKNAFYNKTSND